ATALEREKLWAGRKGAFAAMGRLAPDYYVQDGVIPRTRLPEILRRVNEAAASRGLRIANVFHAGDGNLHPLIVFDLRKEPDALRRAQEAGLEILAACVEAGGSITCARALAGASAERRSMRIAGALSKAYLGELRATDVELRTVRIAGVVDHVPADLTITLAGGTPFAEMAAALARAGQFLPLDPPHA